MSRDGVGGVPVQLSAKASSATPSRRGFPAAQGLYDPANEHDACGVSFVAQIDGTRSHRLVQQAIGSLCNLEHRGATGAEVNTGDGAGILIQIPDRFLRSVVDFELPPEGAYAVGLAFLPSSTAETDDAAEAVGKVIDSEGLTVLGWRDVPIDPVGADIGYSALGVMPTFRQVFISSPEGLTGIELDRRVFVARKRVEHELLDDAGDPLVYFPSLSSRTLVYKGMLTTDAAGVKFFPDLMRRACSSRPSRLVHSRFSTNTFPSVAAERTRTATWLTTARSTRCRATSNWMRAREAHAASRRTVDPRRPEAACSPSCSPERIGLGQLRQRAGAAAPRRSFDLPHSSADDDPRGVGEPRRP